MKRIINGAKAGLLAGLAHGLTSAILATFLILSTKGEVIAILREALKERHLVGAEEQLFTFIITFIPIVAIVIGLLVGMIAGIIFAIIQSILPSENQVVKAVLYSLMVWIILSLSNITTSTSFWLTIVPAIIYGITLGLLFQRFLEEEIE